MPELPVRPDGMDRRAFLQTSLTATAGAALAVAGGGMAAWGPAQARAASTPASGEKMPQGKIGRLQVSRLLLGGNLLTHYTHSRDLQYVYALAARYNTEAKILETLAVAESHGIDTLVIHTVPETLAILKKHRHERGGKMQWIICPTAPLDADLAAYEHQVQELVKDGAEAIYLWGVRSDDLVHQGKMDLVARAVDIAKRQGVPSGVGAHDLQVIVECEKANVGADFYIKTFHHHNYPSAPKPPELTRAHSEVPGYWCREPEKTIETMAGVTKPWIAFKVMAAGAIPPANAFRYVIANGADHILAGMFDFEIAEDARLAREAMGVSGRKRPWCS